MLISGPAKLTPSVTKMARRVRRPGSRRGARENLKSFAVLRKFRIRHPFSQIGSDRSRASKICIALARTLPVFFEFIRVAMLRHR
jgi:hypothetical protein